MASTWAGATRARRPDCALTWTKTEADWALRNATTAEKDRRRHLRDLLGARTKVAAVAVDGPLRPGLRKAFAHRTCEAILSRGALQRRGKPGSTGGGSGPQLHREATRLARTALALCSVTSSRAPTRVHDTRVVEAFPNLFLGTLLDLNVYPASPDRKRKWTDTLFPLVRERLRALLEHLLPGRALRGSLDVRDHEEIAAIACAVTALCAATGQYCAVGADEDGFILLPPLSFFGIGWFDDLRANIAACRSDFARASLYVGRQRLL